MVIVSVLLLSQRGVLTSRIQGFGDDYHITIKLANKWCLQAHLRREHMLPVPPGSELLQLPMIKDRSVVGGRDGGNGQMGRWVWARVKRVIKSVSFLNCEWLMHQ